MIIIKYLYASLVYGSSLIWLKVYFLKIYTIFLTYFDTKKKHIKIIIFKSLYKFHIRTVVITPLPSTDWLIWYKNLYKISLL